MIQENASVLSKHVVRPVLSDDQHKICERLLLLGKVREMSSESTVSVTVLRRWSVPLLVGPAGSGKGFVCEEVARRSGNKPYRRWELGSWIIVANRSSGTTLEEIQQFITDNPTGCVIYLAGVDTLGQIEERATAGRPAGAPMQSGPGCAPGWGGGHSARPSRRVASGMQVTRRSP